MKTIKSILLTVLFTIVSLQLNAQKNYLVAKSAFEVAGTSTVHDWVMKSSEGSGIANLTVKGFKLTEINNLTITLPAESIKSPKTSMDEIAYETLETKTHKNIKYVLKSATQINETTWVLLGTYTIAGVSRDYKTQISTVSTNGNIILQGSNQITFADFEMAPPQAALGIVKAGKNLTIMFRITLSQEGHLSTSDYLTQAK
ncbi:YceI family protein [Flavobacterium sp. FlaQc-52]|jgi:hypothetical protein|uniref:YceI family protein n=1 Tax=Flavobacterium sp. FlaQc-52 TaxID=3374185 RepID=UPI0037580CE8